MPSLKGERNPNWNGGRFIDLRGHVRILDPLHPKADCKGYVKEHIILAEKALGKSLPLKAVVHHHSSDQLVICENQAYHLLLHKRMRAYRAIGHANAKYNRRKKEYIWLDPKEVMAQPKMVENS